MINAVPWLDRNFPPVADPKTFPCVVERLRGTPTRIHAKLAGTTREAATIRYEGCWSILENVGHLADLEALWMGRLDDIQAGRDELRPADLENAATHEAHHNTAMLDDLLSTFRSARTVLVQRLDALDEQGVLASAFHPRLRQPMRVIDLATFVADHDDHHLARMQQLLQRAGVEPRSHQ